MGKYELGHTLSHFNPKYRAEGDEGMASDWAEKQGEWAYK
jgi:hypothetical protein